jgi:hypothetical protein
MGRDPNAGAVVLPAAIARTLGGDWDARAVRKFVRENAVALTGEHWPDTRTEHRYSPTLARDIVNAARQRGNGGEVLKSKSERTTPATPKPEAS